MQWLLIHVSNCATFVSTLYMHIWALIGTLAYYYEDFPHWWCHRDIPVMSLGVGIPSLTVISFSASSNSHFMQWPLIHVSNSATFVGTLSLHVWAPTGTLAYYKGFPCWWHHRNTPVMSSGVGIPSHMVPSAIPFYLFDLDLILKLFSAFSHTCISLLVSYWLDK